MIKAEKSAPGPIHRLLQLLRYLSEVDGEISIRNAARDLDIPVSTIHRLFSVLVEQGFAQKNPQTAHYSVGVDFIRMGFLLSARESHSSFAARYVKEVVAECNEACMFVAYLPATRQVSVMTAENSTHPLRYEMELYVPHSLVWGATGRSVLSFLPEDEQKAAVKNAMPSPVTGQKLPSWDEFKAMLSEFRAQGYVRSQGQKIAGAVGMGAPVFGREGAVIGSLCITIPSMRFDNSAEAGLAQLLIRKAQDFSRALGYTGNYPGQ